MYTIGYSNRQSTLITTGRVVSISGDYRNDSLDWMTVFWLEIDGKDHTCPVIFNPMSKAYGYGGVKLDMGLLEDKIKEHGILELMEQAGFFTEENKGKSGLTLKIKTYDNKKSV